MYVCFVCVCVYAFARECVRMYAFMYVCVGRACGRTDASSSKGNAIVNWIALFHFQYTESSQSYKR